MVAIVLLISPENERVLAAAVRAASFLDVPTMLQRWGSQLIVYCLVVVLYVLVLFVVSRGKHFVVFCLGAAMAEIMHRKGNRCAKLLSISSKSVLRQLFSAAT